MSIREVTRADLPAILRLNQASVAETSDLDSAKLATLASRANYFAVFAHDDAIDGFLLGFRENAAYDNPNFRWFRDRFSRFLYIDRIVVRLEQRQRRIGSQLYEDVERHARATAVDLLTCEVNTQPANLASLDFHRKRGFVEVGTLSIPSHEKIVSLQVRRLTD